MAEDDFPVSPQIATLSILAEKRRERGRCDHRRLFVDAAAGLVTCQDCNADVPPFEALVTISRQTSILQRQWQAFREDTAKLREYKPWLRAVRALEEIWRGRNMLPCCPHCGRGIEADQLARTGRVNRQYDLKMAADQKDKD